MKAGFLFVGVIEQAGPTFFSISLTNGEGMSCTSLFFVSTTAFFKARP